MILNDLPDTADVWIYAASRSLTPAEVDSISSSLQRFFANWESHGRKVDGQAQFVGDRFLIIGAHVPGGDISGCGIDASARAVSIVDSIIDVSWVSNLSIGYRDAADNIKLVGRPTFRKLVASGEITDETKVFDLSVSKLSDFREGKFEAPFLQSWHGAHFARPTIAS